MFYSYPFGTINVISEGEEGVRTDGDGLQGADPVLLFSHRQRLRHLFIHRLPNCQVWALSTHNTGLLTHLGYFVIRHDTEHQKSDSVASILNDLSKSNLTVQVFIIIKRLQVYNVTTAVSYRCHHTSPMVSLTYWSIALAISARFTPLRNFMLRTRGLCLSHQLSALSPASRVQWIRDC